MYQTVEKNHGLLLDNSNCAYNFHVPRERTHVHPCSCCGSWWHIGRDDAFPPEGRGFESRSRRHDGTLNQFFSYSCL